MFTKYEDEHLVQKVAEYRRRETPRGQNGGLYRFHISNNPITIRLNCYSLGHAAGLEYICHFTTQTDLGLFIVGIGVTCKGYYDYQRSQLNAPCSLT